MVLLLLMRNATHIIIYKGADITAKRQALFVSDGRELDRRSHFGNTDFRVRSRYSRLFWSSSRTLLCSQAQGMLSWQARRMFITNNRCDSTSLPCCRSLIFHNLFLGTLCYCDDFCNRTRSEDCCPDFWSHCKGIIDPPPEVIKTCYYEGHYYAYGKVAKKNCNIW